MQSLINYDHLRKIVREKALDEEDARNFSQFATRQVADAQTASALRDLLRETLGNITVGHWLGPDVAAALRHKAAGIIDEIERAAQGNAPQGVKARRDGS